jgi:hypothetical protein
MTRKINNSYTASDCYLTYLHCRPDGSPFYVGKGKVERMNRTKRNNPYHTNVVNKYGKDNILKGFLPCSTEAIALELEVGMIKCFKRMGVKLTNMTDGGEGTSGYKHTTETLAKLRGRTLSDEHKAKLLAARKGIPMSEEAKEKISSSNKGRKFTDEHKAKLSAVRKGKKLSDETRAKMSAAAKGKIVTVETRARMSAVNMGKVMSEETKAKISATKRKQFQEKRNAA